MGDHLVGRAENRLDLGLDRRSIGSAGDHHPDLEQLTLQPEELLRGRRLEEQEGVVVTYTRYVLCS